MRGLPSTFLVLVSVVGSLLVSCESGEKTAPPAARVLGRQGVRPGDFVKPRAVGVDRRTGNFVIVDRRAMVQVYSAAGDLTFYWKMPDSQNGQPVGAHFESDGHLLISDSHYQRIVRYRLPDFPEAPGSSESPGSSERSGSEVVARELDPADIAVSVWGELGKGEGQWTWGRDICVDSKGAIYLGDTGGSNDRIIKFDRDGRHLLSFGSHGIEIDEFDHPSGMDIEVTPDGEFLLVADMNNHRIKRYDLEGRLVSVWGTLGREPGQLRFPRSVVVGEDGTVFVCEWGNNRVQRFDRDGRSLGTWGKVGSGVGELLTPWDFDRGPGHRFVIADYGNHRVQVFDWADS